MMLARIWLGLACLLFASTAPAVAAETDKAVVLLPARYLDVRTWQYVTGRGLVIEDGRIIRIVQEASLASLGLRIIRLPDLTLIPGLIDCHTHLLVADDPRLDDDANMLLTVTGQSEGARLLLGAANAREAVEAGVTTVRDVGNSGRTGAIDLRNAIAAGRIIGPRIVASARALSPVGGQFPKGLNPALASAIVDQEYRQVRNPDDAREAVREASAAGADVIKVIGDAYGNRISLAEMTAIVDQAHRQGMKVAVHAVVEDEVNVAIQAGVDSIEHAYRAVPQDLRAMQQKHMALVPTDAPWADMIATAWRDDGLSAESFAALRAKQRASYEGRRRRLLDAAAAGTAIVFGSDMYYKMPDKTRGVASLATLTEYVDAGLSPQAAIASATVNAAELLGIKDIGAIGEGMSADLVGVPGDPLHDISVLLRPGFVMARGKFIIHGEAGAKGI